MPFTRIFNKEPTPPASPPVVSGSSLVPGAGNSEANRLALLELMRAWEAARVKTGLDVREKALFQKHLEVFIDRYALRVKGMSTVANPSDREVGLTALALVRSSGRDAQTVLAELNRLLRSGGGSGSSQPAA